MSDKCTLYCSGGDRALIEVAIRKVTSLVVAPMDDARDWQQLHVVGPKGKLRFHASVPVVPGDEFSHLILGTYNYADHIPALNPARKRGVLQHIAATKLILGVVGEPDFSSEDDFDCCIEAAAHASGAIVLLTAGFVNASGEPLLWDDGSS